VPRKKYRLVRAADPKAPHACWAELRDRRDWTACSCNRRPGFLTCRYHTGVEAEAQALKAGDAWLPPPGEEESMGTATRFIVIETDEDVLGFATQVAAGVLDPAAATLSRTTAEAALEALLERVDLEYLHRLKLTGLGAVQRRRLKAERDLRYQADPG